MAERQEHQGKKKKAKVRRFYDYSLLFTIIFLILFGLVMIYSSSSYSAQLTYDGDSFHFVRRQGLIALGSLAVMIAISKMDYHFFARFARFSYILSYILMFLVMTIGKTINGQKRWLGVVYLTIHPTEFVKIALILYLSAIIVKMGKRVNKKEGLWAIAIRTFPIGAIVAVNNLSSGLIIMGIGFVMAFVASKRKAPFLACAGLVLAAYFTAGPIVEFIYSKNPDIGYRLSRILVWRDPEAFATGSGYQVLQGLYAIGSGGLWGKGLGESVQKLGFLPEAENDMIFSVICEELGLFGAVSIILVFLFMIYRFMVIANNAPDLFGAMLVVGVMGHIAIQVILNIAVVTNTIPNTGITLPFISYGGTSVLFLMAEMGMVLSVSNQIKLEK